MVRKCIIYGGGGFIGSHIADKLLEDNYAVTVFDKLNSSTKNLDHIIDDINFIEGDFTNSVDLRKSLKNQDYVIHLVSSTLPATSNLNPYYDVESNLISSLHLLNECAKQEVKKIIFISSGGTVYGNPIYIPLDEQHPTNPISSYGIIKLTIEKYLGLYLYSKKLDYSILRFSNPFGERQNPKLGQGLITNMLHKIKQREDLEVWGDGKNVRDFFYIKDGADAVSKALQYKGKHKLFNIASSKGMSVNDILNKFRQVLKLKFKVNYLPAREFDVRKNILDIKLAKQELKWTPASDINESLKNTWRYILADE